MQLIEEKKEVVFILDQSGSMASLATDTIGGFNSTLKRIRESEGEVLVTTVLFNDKVHTLHDRIPLCRVSDMTEHDYTPAGSTALLDAIGETVEHISSIHRYARPEDVPEHTLFFITTDGFENASRRFGADKVREMIREKTKKLGWEFNFLAANIDAMSAAAGIGIPRENAHQVRSDSEGVRQCFMGIANTVCRPRPQRKEK